jgi:hypothetical protein
MLLRITRIHFLDTHDAGASRSHGGTAARDDAGAFRNKGIQ